MSYQEDGNRITLEMTRDDYAGLLIALGYVTGSVPRSERRRFYGWLNFVNRLNEGNSNFTPYEIPEEFQGQGWQA